MRLHPREAIVSRARADLAGKIADWYKSHEDLTDGELLNIVGGVFGTEVARMAKYMIRDERHPDDPDKPGGLA